MNSGDKSICMVCLCSVLLMLGLYCADKWHNQTMQRIENAKNQRAMSLKVELEQAKANQARYRALEVGYLCQFIDKTGAVYFNAECEE